MRGHTRRKGVQNEIYFYWFLLSLNLILIDCKVKKWPCILSWLWNPLQLYVSFYSRTAVVTEADVASLIFHFNWPTYDSRFSLLLKEFDSRSRNGWMRARYLWHLLKLMWCWWPLAIGHPSIFHITHIISVLFVLFSLWFFFITCAALDRQTRSVSRLLLIQIRISCCHKYNLHD